MTSDAIFSPGRRYRYWLRRSWGVGPEMLWIGLNPSIAAETVNDPTVRREIQFTKDAAGDFGGYQKVNLFDLVSTDPKGLLGVADAEGSENRANIEVAISNCEKIVCAWGTVPLRLAYLRLPLIQFVNKIAEREKKELYCLGTCQDGQPRHPLYVRRDKPLDVYWS